MVDRGAPADPREELTELVAAVRAYVEWQADTGASGLPIEEAPEVVMARLSAGPTGRATPAGARPAAASPPRAEAGRPGVPAYVQSFAAGPQPASPAAPAAPAAPRAAEPAATPRPAPVAAAAIEPAATPRPAAVAPAPVPTAPAARPVAAVVVESANDERRTRLALLAEEVRSCTRCSLHEARQQTVFSRGDPFSELCFIGEGPGADEDALGEPFVGAAGKLLDRMIAAMGYQRDEVYIANIVKCRPPNNRKPEPSEMASCMPYLTQQLALIKPRVIVALGATAVQGMIGTSEGITRMRGKWKLYKGSIPIMPTFHPAYLLRTPAAKREVWNDLQEVMKHLGKAPAGKA